MMTPRMFLMLVSATTLSACADSAPRFSGDVRGKVQKGPFINGAEVAVAELTTTMMQTGRTFASTISDDTGAFRVPEVELANSVARVRATGYYFDETAGAISDGPLSLVTYVDFADGASANLNVLGHLQSSRVEYLVQEEGMAFAAARAQAHAEVLAVFGFVASTGATADTLDVTAAGEDNAMLLAASVILQSTRSVGQLSELLSAIQTDLRADGVLDSTASRTALMNGAWAANPARIRAGLVARLDALGVAATIPAFEPYLEDFIETMPYPYTGAITYPSDPLRPNVLELDRTAFDTNWTANDTGGLPPYQFVAEIPPNTELTLRMTWTGPEANLMANLWSFDPDGDFDYFTHVATNTAYSQSWTAKKSGRVTMGFNLVCGEPCTDGQARLEYFEYGRTEPTRVKTIRWGAGL